MSNIVTTLLDFILDLLRDPQAAEEFNNNPHAALASAGLADVGPNDVQAVMPMLADCSPVRNWSGGGQDGHPVRPQGHDYDHDQHVRPIHDDHCDRDEDHKPSHDHKPWDDNDHSGQGQEYAVIEHIKYIQNNYSVTEIDASHSVWVGGDVNVLFGDDNVLATNGAVALDNVHGVGPISVDNSVDNSTHDDHSSVDVDVKDALNGSFNDVSGDGSAAGNGNTVSTDNSQSTDDHSVDVTVDDSNVALGGQIADRGGEIADKGGQIADRGGQNSGDGGTNADDSQVSGDNGTNATDSQVSGDGGQNAALGGQNGDHGAQVADDGAQNADQGGQNADDGGSNTDVHAHVDVTTDDINVVDHSDGAVVGNDITNSFNPDESFNDGSVVDSEHSLAANDNEVLSDNHVLSDNFSHDQLLVH